MAALDPFQPDDIYCVHCHAPAAGMCADCGALCCGDCVELRLGLTRERAVCRLCLAAEPETSSKRGRGPWIAATAVVLFAIAWWIL